MLSLHFSPPILCWKDAPSSLKMVLKNTLLFLQEVVASF